MAWVFIFGVFYGLMFMLNIRLCQRFTEAGMIGSVSGIMITGFATLLALTKNGAQMAPHDWLLPFLGFCVFFTPNYISAIGVILEHEGDK